MSKRKKHAQAQPPTGLVSRPTSSAGSRRERTTTYASTRTNGEIRLAAPTPSCSIPMAPVAFPILPE